MIEVHTTKTDTTKNKPTAKASTKRGTKGKQVKAPSQTDLSPTRLSTDAGGRAEMLIKQGTQQETLLSLIAITGDYPASNISFIIPNKDYASRTTIRMEREGLIRQFRKDGMRSFRLTAKGKAYMVESNLARYERYNIGKTETNQPPGTPARRKRVLSISEVITLMYMAGVDVYADTRPDIFGEGLNTPSPPEITHPTYYSSRDYVTGRGSRVMMLEKQPARKEDKAPPPVPKGSRGAGVLLSPSRVFCVYNSGDVIVDWSPEVESKYRNEVRHTIVHKICKGQYGLNPVDGIMLGSDMALLGEYLDLSQKKARVIKMLEKTYESLYYVTSDDRGIEQLKMLSNDNLYAKFTNMILSALQPKTQSIPMSHDAMSKDGRPVTLQIIIDLPKLIRFRSALKLHGLTGQVYCFDHQADVIGRYLGVERAEILKLNFELMVKKLVK